MASVRILHVDDEPDIREVVEISLDLDPAFAARRGMMSNIIGLFDGERRDPTVTPSAEIGADGLQSLLGSWSLIRLLSAAS